MPKAPKRVVDKAPEPVEITQPAVSDTVAELPLDAHTYYVYNADKVFVKFFTNEQFKGEALKFAKQFAEEIGGYVQI